MSSTNEMLTAYQDDQEYRTRKKILKHVWMYLVYRYVESGITRKSNENLRLRLEPWLDQALELIEKRIQYKHHYTLGF